MSILMFLSFSFTSSFSFSQDIVVDALNTFGEIKDGMCPNSSVTLEVRLLNNGNFYK